MIIKDKPNFYIDIADGITSTYLRDGDMFIKQLDNGRNKVISFAYSVSPIGRFSQHWVSEETESYLYNRYIHDCVKRNLNMRTLGFHKYTFDSNGNFVWILSPPDIIGGYIEVVTDSKEVPLVFDGTNVQVPSFISDNDCYRVYGGNELYLFHNDACIDELLEYLNERYEFYLDKDPRTNMDEDIIYM